MQIHDINSHPYPSQVLTLQNMDKFQRGEYLCTVYINLKKTTRNLKIQEKANVCSFDVWGIFVPQSGESLDRNELLQVCITSQFQVS